MDEPRRIDPALDLVESYATDARVDLAARDQAIVLARNAGKTYRQIAGAAKLTPQGVRKIVTRLDNSVHTGTMDT